MIKSDKLFLAHNCPDCDLIKSHIAGPTYDDSIVGFEGQILTVVQMFSNNATRDILDIFGLENNYAPVLLTHADDVIDGPENILSYLINNGLAV